MAKSSSMRESSTPHIRDSQVLVRERGFPPTMDIASLLHFLRDQRSTGKLMIDMNQGGIGTIRFREEAHVVPGEDLS